MNFLKYENGLFEKLHGWIFKYSTSSITHRRSRQAFIKTLLQTRIRLFLEGRVKNNKEEIDKQKSSPSLKVNDLTNTNNLLRQENLSEYNQLVYSINSLSTAASGSNFTNSLNVIDDGCCKLLGKLTAAQIFNLLHLLAKTGCDITKLKSYRGLLLALRKYLENDKLSMTEKLQLIFFEGLGKKSAKKNIRYFLKFLPPLSELSLMEKAVVAHATFKCNVALDRESARSLQEALENNAAELVHDPAILCTICKAVSFAGGTDDLSLANLSREIVEKEEIWSLTSSAHLLGMYAAANRNDPAPIDRLFRDSMKSISPGEGTWNSMPPRIKDVDRIVWALSVFNYRLRDEDKAALSSFVLRRYKEFTTKPFLLVNTLLALWILRCRLHIVVEKCLVDGVFHSVNEQEERWKPAARLHLLLNCVKIESPETKLPAELFRARKVRMKRRECVKSLYGVIDGLRTDLDIDEATIDCPINGIHIAGVSLGIEGKLIHLDLLDETTCFRDTTTANGLTNLKIRLLKKIGFRSILIPENRSKDDEFIANAIKSIRNTP